MHPACSIAFAAVALALGTACVRADELPGSWRFTANGRERAFSLDIGRIALVPAATDESAIVKACQSVEAAIRIEQKLGTTWILSISPRPSLAALAELGLRLRAAGAGEAAPVLLADGAALPLYIGTCEVLLDTGDRVEAAAWAPQATLVELSGRYLASFATPAEALDQAVQMRAAGHPVTPQFAQRRELRPTTIR